GLLLPVSIGRLVSQCAEAMTMPRGLPRRRPSASHALPAGPACRACIGEPWEMKTLGNEFPDSRVALVAATAISPVLPPSSLPGPWDERRRAPDKPRGSATS